MNKKQELRHITTNMVSTLTWWAAHDELQQFSVEYSPTSGIWVYYTKGGIGTASTTKFFSIYPGEEYGDDYEDVYDFVKKNIERGEEDGTVSKDAPDND
jgi:hypothetical protein